MIEDRLGDLGTGVWLAWAEPCWGRCDASARCACDVWRRTAIRGPVQPFLENRRVTTHEMLAVAGQAVGRRAAGRHVLAIMDTPT